MSRGSSLECDVMPPSEVVVIGGGVIGLACAWRLAGSGREVVVLDPQRPGAASYAAGGMLAPVTEVTYGEEPLLELNLASSRRWQDFASELEAVSGGDTGYARSGTLLVARDRDDLEALGDLREHMLGIGLEVEHLGSREIRSLEPALAPTVRGGIHAPADHRVDNIALLGALRGACDEAGVRTVRRAATSLVRRGGRVRGAVLDDDREVEADVVVLAAGAWSGEIDGVPDVVREVRPVKGEALLLEARQVPPLIERTVRGLDVYLVPRSDGRVVIGATVLERGFETSMSAGAVLDLLREAYRLLPGVAELDLVDLRVGLRPGSPDNAPLIGEIEDGLIVATGHHRNGLLLAPLTAEAVVVLAAGGEPPSPVASFSPDRLRHEGAA